MNEHAYRRQLRAAHSRRFRESLSTDDFSRHDEEDDASFYGIDRFVTHLDRRARRTVEKLIGKLLVDDDQRVLDLMASWDSHLPPSRAPKGLVGLGLNPRELEKNEQLSEHVIHDLNRDPTLPFADESFDAVLNTVSIDYLTRPFEVLDEVARVLRPGGLLLVIFSNRMFEAKATRLWRRASEEERVILVEEFVKSTLAFHPPGLFVSRGLPRPDDDPYAAKLAFSDPVYAVWAEKEGRGALRRPRTVTLAEQRLPERRASTAEVAETLTCGYCSSALERLPLYDDWGDGWGAEAIYVCLDDGCPYFTAHFATNYRTGMPGTTFRFMYDPAQHRCGPLPVSSPRDLKNLVEPAPASTD